MAPNYNFHSRELLIESSLVRNEQFHLAERVYQAVTLALPTRALLSCVYLGHPRESRLAIKTGSSKKLGLFVYGSYNFFLPTTYQKSRVNRGYFGHYLAFLPTLIYLKAVLGRKISTDNF